MGVLCACGCRLGVWLMNVACDVDGVGLLLRLG